MNSLKKLAVTFKNAPQKSLFFCLLDLLNLDGNMEPKFDQNTLLQSFNFI